MKKLFKAIAAAGGVGIAAYAVSQRGKPKKKSDVWNTFAPVYDLFISKDRKAYEEMYRRIRAAVGGKRVLELCTGTGLIARHVADVTAETVATDFAEKMLAEARKGNVPANLAFRQADATALPFVDDSFDVVIISNALHIIPQPERALAEARRVLKPGGLLIAPNFLDHRSGGVKSALAKLLTTAGVVFEVTWDEAGYLEFLEKNGWHVRESAVLKASFPLMYTACEDADASTPRACPSERPCPCPRR